MRPQQRDREKEIRGPSRLPSALVLFGGSLRSCAQEPALRARILLGVLDATARFGDLAAVGCSCLSFLEQSLASGSSRCGIGHPRIGSIRHRQFSFLGLLRCRRLAYATLLASHGCQHRSKMPLTPRGTILRARLCNSCSSPSTRQH